MYACTIYYTCKGRCEAKTLFLRKLLYPTLAHKVVKGLEEGEDFCFEMQQQRPGTYTYKVNKLKQVRNPHIKVSFSRKINLLVHILNSISLTFFYPNLYFDLL